MTHRRSTSHHVSWAKLYVTVTRESISDKPLEASKLIFLPVWATLLRTWRRLALAKQEEVVLPLSSGASVLLGLRGFCFWDRLPPYTDTSTPWCCLSTSPGYACSPCSPSTTDACCRPCRPLTTACVCVPAIVGCVVRPRLQGMHVAPVAHRLLIRGVDHVDH